jgi:hypothetical protein
LFTAKNAEEALGRTLNRHLTQKTNLDAHHQPLTNRDG